MASPNSSATSHRLAPTLEQAIPWLEVAMSLEVLNTLPEAAKGLIG